MGGEKESPKPIEAGVARDVVRRHSFEVKTSPEYNKKRAIARAETETRAREEHKFKLKEGTDLLSLRVQIATTDSPAADDLPVDDESCCLNTEEKKAYCEMIDQCVDDPETTKDDKEAVRRNLVEVIFKPRVFQVHYKRWRSTWDDSPTLQQKFPEFKDYVFDRAKAFILSNRNKAADAQVRKFQEDHLPKASSPDKQKEQLKELQKKTRQFMKVHEAEILTYITLDEKDPKRELLFKKFIIEAGLQGAEIEAARQLFEDIIDDVGAAFAAIKKLEATNDKMVLKAQKALDENEDIDEEDWDKMLEESLKDDPFFKEVMQQQQGATYQATEAAAKAPLDSPEAVALQAGGLRIMGYDPKTDTYTVRYPDSTLETKMKIIPRKGSKTYDDATFIFYDKYADKAKGSEVTLNSQNLRSGCNRMFLDYLMNDWIRQNKVSPDFNVNDILKDDTMLRMAERLFGRNLNDIVLTKNMRGMFSRFLEVLMKGDSSSSAYGNLGSFEARVKKMDVVMMNPTYAKLLYKEFENVGSVAFTVSTLLEQIGYKS